MSLTARALAVPGPASSVSNLVAGQVVQLRGGGLLLPDREDLGDLAELAGLLDGGVAAERLDHRQALVAGGGRAAPPGLQPVQEPQDAGPVDVGQAQLLRWYPLGVPEPGEQQFHRVAVGGDGFRRGGALPGQVAGEELRQPASGEVGGGAGRWLTIRPRAGRG